jgi:predicted permease
MTHDFRQALRLLRLNPGFATLAILTLALGIGACVTMFSIINGVLLRPLPYAEPERLVALWEVSARGNPMQVAWPNFLDWREQSKTLNGVAAYQGGPTTILGGTEALRGSVYSVSEGYFKVLGVTPQSGRLFTDAEERAGGPPVAVVSEAFWHRAFGDDTPYSPHTLTIDTAVVTVVGVMPMDFAYPNDGAVWIPASLDDGKGTRTAHNFHVIGRMAPGQTIESTRSEMAGIAARLKAMYGPEENAEAIQVLDLRDNLVGPSRTPLQVLMGAVLLVLLIACANLANTLLAGGMKRRREIAMRAALGASRPRLIQQLLTENLVLAALGGIAGLAVSSMLLPVLLRLAPSSLPRLENVHIDARVAAFAMLLTLVTVAIFGLLPALQTARADLRDVLADSARGSSAAPRTARMRALLIAGQVAVAFVLLVGSGLLIKSLGALLSQPMGFDPTNILTVELAVPRSYVDDPAVAALYDRLLTDVRRLPGVEQATVADNMPLTEWSPNGTFAAGGSNEATGNAIYRVADAAYFQTLRVPLLEGRTFDSHDGFDGEHVCLVSKSLADHHWPGRSAIGQRVRPLGMDRYKDKWLTVVGVVANVKARGLARDNSFPEIYVNLRQRPQRARWGYLAVRATATGSGDAATAQASAIRAVLKAIDPNLPPKFETYDALVAKNIADRRFMMRILTVFGGLALLLTAIGIYGVLAYTVAQRTSEIGIRMALGATRGSVVQLILRHAFKSIAIGLTIGGIGAWLLTGTIRSFLYNVQPADPLVAAAALLALLAAAGLAAGLPAWRASRIDPQVSMRTE